MTTTSTRPQTAKGFTEPLNLPKYLQEHGRFCLWKYTQDDKGKWTKPPYKACFPASQASKNTPADFTDMATALSYSAGYDGLGVHIGFSEDVSAIDIDHCFDEAGNLSMLAQSVIDLMDTYTERSPSGQGIRIFFRIAPGFVYDRKSYLIKNSKATDPREEWPQAQGLEVYVANPDNTYYVTVTGDIVRAGDVQERTQQLLQVLKRYMARPVDTMATKRTAQPVGASLGLSDRELIDKAKSADNGAKFTALWNGDWQGAGYGSQSEADLALCSMLAYWTGRDTTRIDNLFRESGLYRGKWDERHGPNTYGEATVIKAVERCNNVYSPRTFDAPPPPEPPAYMVQQPEAQRKPEQESTQKKAASRPAVKADLRNHPAFRIAANLRAQGVPEDKIHAQLVSYANNDCVPPMQEEQIEAIYNLVLSYPAKTKLAQMLPGKERLSRAALAEQMEAMGFGIRYNVITCEYEPLGRTEAGRVMSQDDLITLLHDALADYFKGVSFDTLNAYVTLQARENEYNPVLDTLRAVEWDGRDRLPQLFELIGIEADNLSQVLVTKWLRQSVALLFNDPADPYGADGVLVFNGEQGAGKTSLFRHLALRDAWFGEGMTVNDRDKDTTRRIVTTWIAELGEVESTLKSDISALKAFVSAAVDHYRLPYGRNDVVAPRMTSLCATCNSDRYLIDPTGNRRWWSVPFSRMIPRAEILALDALQLWAQIFAEVAPLPYDEKSACFRLTDEEKAALAQRNGDYEKPLKGQPEIEDILARAERDNLPTKTLTASDWKEYWPALRPYDARQIGAALKKCEIITEERKIEGRKGRWAELPVPRSSY